MLHRTTKNHLVRFVRGVTIFMLTLSFLYFQTTTLDLQDSVTSNQASPPYLDQLLSFFGEGFGGMISGILLGRAIDPPQKSDFPFIDGAGMGALVGFWFGGFKAMELTTKKHGAPEGSEVGALIGGYIVGESFNFVTDALPTNPGLKSQIEFIQIAAVFGAFLAGYNYKYIMNHYEKRRKVDNEKKVIHDKTKD